MDEPRAPKGAEIFQFYFEKYKNFVKNKPLVASELEISLKWISYIAAGRFGQSPVLSELVHAASNLLTLINDSILRKATKIPVHLDARVERVLTCLSVIEYVEVFAEVAAYRFGGYKVKWLVIVVIQLVKMAIRLILLVKHRQGLFLSPPIPALDRKIDIPQPSCSNAGPAPFPEACSPSSNVEVTFTLKRSGRIIRTLEAAPPLASRTWKPPLQNSKSRLDPPTALCKEALVGELISMSRPITHIAAMRIFGTSSWKPWFIALAMDIASLNLLRCSDRYSHVEKLEISRRALMLLMYILRSPFYDNYSKARILSLLSSFARVRGLGFVVRPILEYLPEWQQMYFYMWASA